MSCGGLPWRFHEGKLQVLLIEQFSGTNRWGIPKGHMHDGETFEQCALREIHEEAGIDVILGQRLPDVGTAFRDEDKTVMTWLAQPVGSDVPRHDDPNSEVADARWFDVGALPFIHVYQQPLVARAVKMLTEAIDDVNAAIERIKR